jgi:hypothetical protein
MDSLAAVPFVYDHDGDGDLDLLVGNIQGRVILIPNEGTSKKFSFDGSKRRALEAGGSPVKVEGDSDPVIADWDGDGRPDLVVGSGDGSVWWFRNTGKKGAPDYAEGAAILPKSARGYDKPVKHGGAPESPGFRTKVHVTDWNGDGLADLLVGDIWYEAAAPIKLTPEQTARRDELKKRQTELNTEYSKLYQELGEKFNDNARAREIGPEMQKIYKELSPLDPHPTPRGSVWLYLREKPVATK